MSISPTNTTPNDYAKIIEKQHYDLEMLEAAINFSNIGVYITDGNGIVLRVNQAHEKVTGIPPEAILGKKTEKIRTQYQHSSATQQVITTRQPVQLEQFLKNGHSYFAYANPYFDDNQNIKYVITNLVDTTEINSIRTKLKKTEVDNAALANKLQFFEKTLELRKILIYTSSIMDDLVENCARIAPFDTTVLIKGDSGVGKEVIAEYIYTNSRRIGKPFIKINCASIPEQLLESELFGYDAGSFTGASSKGKKGLLEIADKGTVFLDEIGEMPLSLQSKLLRFLQEGEIVHIGGTHSIKVDVRVIAATNKNLEKMVSKGTFRQDLFYRLNVIPMHVPPLNQRREDIPFLLRAFINEINEKCELNKTFSPEVTSYLTSRTYTGNVRELKNITERLLLLSKKDVVDKSDLEDILHENMLPEPTTFADIMEEYEKEILKKYLARYKTTVKMSEALNISQPTISRKLKKYNLT